MNKTNILPLIVLAVLTGCKAEEEGQLPDGPVNAALAFTVSSDTGGDTRMASGVVQSGSSYRNLQAIRIFTYKISGNQVTSDDSPISYDINSDGTRYTGKTVTEGNTTHPANFYLIDKCTFLPGVNAMLAYANAAMTNVTLPTYSGDNDTDSKFYFGSLENNINPLGKPELTSFAPVQIVESTDVITDDGSNANKLAAYLTGIAEAWGDTNNAVLKDFYKRFIGLTDDGSTVPIASSSANILQYVGMLRELISGLTGLSTAEAAIQSSIITAIDAGYNPGEGDNPKPQLKNLPTNYPASIGLPAGAAAVRWNKDNKEFEVQTKTTTLDNINTITRFAYPAELWYYTNSLIKTSNESQKTLYTTKDDWTDVLTQYKGSGEVSSSTKSVAIIEPLQYAVARLEVILNKTKTTIPDADGVNMTVDTDNFPLTGIIVGQQRPVGFDFKPTVTKGEDGKYSDLDVRFAYDPYPVDASSNAIYLSSASNSAATSTLVLQTPDDEEVTILLEFENNSGKQFRGRSGIIYPGTKFYLTGTLDPNDGTTTNANATGRVFTQDFTTSVSATVSSLENAYNVMPNILQGRLEIGVELTTKWEPTTPVTVPLN